MPTLAEVEVAIIAKLGPLMQSSREAENRIDQLDRKLAQAGKKAAPAFRAATTEINTMNSSLNRLLASAATYLGVREIVQYADAWTTAGNKMKAAAEIAGVQTRSLEELNDMAIANRSSFQATVDLYAKLIRSASGVVESEAEIAQMTDTVTKAFKAGGATMQEQISGITQLGQALGSGILQGDELRSLRENAPLLAKAIADEFKTTIGGLKELGAEGKLTSDRIAKAIIAGQKEIDDAFKATSSTIADAIGNVENAFIEYIGQADAANGATQKIVEALTYLTQNFAQVADVVVQFATVLIGALTGRALLGVVAGLGNAVIALGAFLTALRTGTIVAAGFTAALGPIGLLAGAAAAAIYLLYQASDSAESSTSTFNEAVKSNQKALENATGATYNQVDALAKLIKMQALAARGASDLAAADYEVAAARSRSFRQLTGGYDFAPFKSFEKEAADRADALGVAAGQLELQLDNINKILAEKPKGENGFGGDIGKVGGGKEKKVKENAFDKEIRQIEERTAELMAQYQAQSQLNPLVNDFGYAVEFAKTKQELLNAALKAGKEVTPALAEKIDMLANAYALAKSEGEKLAEAQDKIKEKAQEFNNLGKDVLGGFIQDIANGEDALKSLLNALQKILDKMLEMALNSLFNEGGGLSGIGGFFANLFKGGGKGLFSSALGATPALASSPARASFSGMSVPTSARAPNLASAQDQRIVVDVGVYDDGKLAVIARREGGAAGRQEASIQVNQYDKTLPDKVKSVQASPRRRRN